MKKFELYPANEEHFKRLIPFAQRILNLLNENGIRAIVYGSFAHFYYTKDRKMEVHDIDIDVLKKNLPKFDRILKKERIKHKYYPKWNTIIITSGDLRIEVDGLGEGYPTYVPDSLLRKGGFNKIDFYGMPIEMITFKQLKEIYPVAYNRSRDDKEKIMKKIKHLEKFLGRKLKGVMR